MADEQSAGESATTESANGGEPAGEDANRTYTQQEHVEAVNRAVESRLARERKKYEGFEDMRTKAAQFDELQEQQMTAIEKANKRAEKAEAAASDRVSKADARLIQAAVLEAGTKLRAVRPEHLHKLLEKDSVTVGDDGQVTGAEDAVKAFLDANPEYVGSPRPTGFADQGARPSPPSQQTFDSVIRQRVAR